MKWSACNVRYVRVKTEALPYNYHKNISYFLSLCKYREAYLFFGTVKMCVGGQLNMLSWEETNTDYTHPIHLTVKKSWKMNVRDVHDLFWCNLYVFYQRLEFSSSIFPTTSKVRRVRKFSWHIRTLVCKIGISTSPLHCPVWISRPGFQVHTAMIGWIKNNDTFIK